MPARNRIKQYVENSYYHIYNRGVEKRLIFLDKQDYSVFLSYLRDYLSFKDIPALADRLSNPDISYPEKGKIIKLLRLNNFYGEIVLLAYCLISNHFHFFVKQKGSLSIDKFMQSLATRYTMYFNHKHHRVGFLYQDVYKAVLLENDTQFVYLSKYIHKQAFIHQPSQNQTPKFREEYPSSYPEYLGNRKKAWVHPEKVLSYFSGTNPKLSYKSFVEGGNDFSPIQNKLLED